MRVYKQALANHWQILSHTNGDRAIDQLLTSMRAAEKAYPGVNVRPVMIHGQTLRKDQVAQLKELKIFPSLFPMPTYYWGDWHRESVLGPERAENISPTQCVRQSLRHSERHPAHKLSCSAATSFFVGRVPVGRQRCSPLTRDLLGQKNKKPSRAARHSQEANLTNLVFFTSRFSGAAARS